jgi:hypothetical protein
MPQTDFSLAREHAIYQLLNAPVREYPSPHSYIENFFPADFYERIQDNMISSKDLQPIAETGRVGGEVDAYKDRYVMPLPSDRMNALNGVQRTFWDGMSELLNSVEMQTALLHKFQPLVDERLGPGLGSDVSFSPETLFMRDQGNYKVGPHTDHPENVIAMLIYLPRTDEHLEWGTSLYAPKDRNFRCIGGFQYDFEYYDRIYTFEYRPNSAAFFLKTSYSFHGVEQNPSADIDRNLIQVCIRHKPITKPL